MIKVYCDNCKSVISQPINRYKLTIEINGGCIRDLQDSGKYTYDLCFNCANRIRYKIGEEKEEKV